MAEPVPYHEKLHTLSTEEFKERCLEIMTHVFEHDGKAIIFYGDEPIVQITRYQETPDPVRGSLKGQVQIHGDIVSPMPPEWYTSCTGHDEEQSA